MFGIQQESACVFRHNKIVIESLNATLQFVCNNLRMDKLANESLS